MDDGRWAMNGGYTDVGDVAVMIAMIFGELVNFMRVDVGDGEGWTLIPVSV